jgi:predicted permease
MDSWLRDLSYALRSLRRSPGFTASAVAALALGIGVNTAIFSVVNAVLLAPAPFPEPDRLVILMNTQPQGTNRAGSPAKFMHWRQQTTVLQDVAAFSTGVVNYTGGDLPEQLRSAQVSADYFRLFGAPVVLGRTFTAAEDLPGGERGVVISEGLWARRFDLDANVLGQTLSLSGDPYIVIGVVGASFDFESFGTAPEVWTAFQFDPNTTDQGHYFQVAGRLVPDVSLTQAQAGLAVSTAAFLTQFPNSLGPESAFGAEPITEALVANVRTSLLVLMGAVSFVLLIACANVANLLLARATARRREIAIRTAIGATRGEIVRQLLVESVALALAAGAIGLILGLTGIRALLRVSTAGLPRLGADVASVGVDWRVVTFTLVVSLVTGLLFGVLPALQASRTNLSESLKESAGRSGTGFRQNKARATLVVVEVALALVLLIGSALLIRTSVALATVDPGFDATNVITMDMSLTGDRFAETAAVEGLVRDGVERLRAVPGIAGASATCCVPLTGGYGLGFTVVGRPLPDDRPTHGSGGWTTTSTGFFDVFRIPVRRGRVFTDGDEANTPPVVVINETMARQFWPDGDPLTDRLVIGRGVMKEFDAEPERQIIGIVADIRDGGLQNDPPPRTYIPQAQVPDSVNALNVGISPMSWIVRTEVDPRVLSEAIQDQLRQASGLPVSDIRTMD